MAKRDEEADTELGVPRALVNRVAATARVGARPNLACARPGSLARRCSEGRRLPGPRQSETVTGSLVVPQWDNRN